MPDAVSQKEEACQDRYMQFLIQVIANAVGIWLASQLLRGLELTTDGTWQNTLLVVLVIAAVFSLVNMVVRPIVKVLTFPLYIITLGLFFLVVNALMLMLTSWITDFFSFGLHIDGFGTAVLASIIISLIATLVSAVLGNKRGALRRR